MSATAIAGLEPAGLFRHFAQFTQTPRPSGREDAIVAYVLEWAAQQGFEVQRDSVGNVCVRVPASAGRENAPVVIIQGHLDMVCERNSDSEYDAETGPLHLLIDGDWITADGTTLGADNAIGVCAAMAAAEDPSVMHGPLELLMTVDEEMGMTGAMGLDPSLLHGRIMLNLDSEEDGQLFVGCSGGCDTNISLDLQREAVAGDTKLFSISVSGLRGGHSGLDINCNRLNAVHALARVVDRALDEELVSLIRFEGGSKRNAIPREAVALVAARPDQLGALRELIEAERAKMLGQYKGLDDGLLVTLSESDPSSDAAWTTAEARRAIAMLRAIPSGVIWMSQDIEGLVETSTNLGVVHTDGDRLHTLSCTRSSVTEAMDATLDAIDAVAHLAGASSERRGAYPGWKPDLDSTVLAVVKRVATKSSGEEPKVCAIHAGLECGLIGERVAGMDMISFGPEIQGAHSPDERLHMESTRRFWALLVAVLDQLSA